MSQQPYHPCGAGGFGVGGARAYFAHPTAPPPPVDAPLPPPLATSTPEKAPAVAVQFQLGHVRPPPIRVPVPAGVGVAPNCYADYCEAVRLAQAHANQMLSESMLGANQNQGATGAAAAAAAAAAGNGMAQPAAMQRTTGEQLFSFSLLCLFLLAISPWEMKAVRSICRCHLCNVITVISLKCTAELTRK